MFEELEKQEESTALHKTVDPSLVAAGLLRNDIPLLLPLLLVLALSSVSQGLFAADLGGGLAGLTFLDRFLELGVMSFIVLRWRKRFEHVEGRHKSNLLSVLHIMAVGAAMWMVISAPIEVAARAPIAWTLPCVFIFSIAAFWSFRLYFYFATIGLLGGSLREVFAPTLSIARKEPLAAIRSLVAPVGVTALVVGLLWYPSPDGRSLFWATAVSAAEGIFWVLSTYTGLAYAMVLIDDHAWRVAGLEPYRKERLRTLEAQGRASHFNWLSPGSGAKIFFIALCLMVGALYQALTIAPAPHIKVVKSEARNHGLRVELEMADPLHKFRGFNPHAFRIASKTGFEISNGVPKVLLGDDQPVSLLLPYEPGPFIVNLDFRSTKTEEALKKLDNMYLWYNLTPLIPITITPAIESQGDRLSPSQDGQKSGMP